MSNVTLLRNSGNDLSHHEPIPDGLRRTCVNRAWAALASAALVLAAGCTGSSAPPETGGTTPVADRGCPSVHGRGYAAIDYVDFIQAFGHQYVAGLGSRPSRVNRSDLGRVVLRSHCSFSALNDLPHKSPGEPRDGDTGFLAPGTPVYSIDGWSTQCRLAARSPTGLVAYLALNASSKHAKPRSCALHN